MRTVVLLSLAMLPLAACATRPEPIALTTAPPPVPIPLRSLATLGMPVPARLPDGGYATPSHGLTGAAAVWHLRAALNVAALACRGPEQAVLVASYNAMLTARKATLASAQTTYAAQYQRAGGDWRDRYDDAMTRVYNFYSQAPARDGFCAAAQTVLADAATTRPESIVSFAESRLRVLEQPFIDLYRAHDASLPAPTPPAPTPPAPKPVVIASVERRVHVTAAPTPPRPRLQLDPAVFVEP